MMIHFSILMYAKLAYGLLKQMLAEVIGRQERVADDYCESIELHRNLDDGYECPVPSSSNRKLGTFGRVEEEDYVEIGNSTRNVYNSEEIYSNIDTTL